MCGASGSSLILVKVSQSCGVLESTYFTNMSWSEVNKEMDKIEQIVQSIETEEDTMEKASKSHDDDQPKEPILLGARPKEPQVQIVEELEKKMKITPTSGPASRLTSSRFV